MPYPTMITCNGKTMNATQWGRELDISVDTILRRHKRGIPLDIPRQRKKKKKTLCWKCENTAYGKCPWFTDFTPVDGWEATPTKIDNSTGGNIREAESYCVHKCPKFEPMAKQKAGV